MRHADLRGFALSLFQAAIELLLGKLFNVVF